jgi:hypothetical protein
MPARPSPQEPVNLWNSDPDKNRFEDCLLYQSCPSTQHNTPTALLAWYRYQDLPADVQGLHDYCSQKAAKNRKKKSPSRGAPPSQDPADALADHIGGLAIATPPGLSAPAGGVTSQSMAAVR